MTLWRLDMGWKKDDPYVSAFARNDKSDFLHFGRFPSFWDNLNWGMQAPRRTMWYNMPNNCRMWFCAGQSSENDSVESLDILLMAEILHQLIGSLSHYFYGFMHPRWCRISVINSIPQPLPSRDFLLPNSGSLDVNLQPGGHLPTPSCWDLMNGLY